MTDSIRPHHHLLDDDFDDVDMTPKPKPTEDQSLALDSMTAFLSPGYDPAIPFYLLAGYAGTGKSFCITELLSYAELKPSQVCFTAPTNKAVKVLRNYLDDAGLSSVSTRTIYSLLGLSLQANGEVKEITRPEEPVDLSSYSVIIVDEASMVNQFLMTAIEDASHDWKVPFIFMGDPAQLPPVGELMSPVFKITNRSTLEKVLRYGNSMLDLATRIRNVVDSPFPKVEVKTDPPVYRLSKPDWLTRITESLDGLRDGSCKIIAWRNVKVDEYNALVRRHIFGPESRTSPWLCGDKIVAKSPLKDLEDTVICQTAEELEVLEVAIGQHPKYQEFEIYNLLCLHESGKKVTIRALTPSGSFHLNNRLNEISMEAKSGKKYKWREFWQLKEAFHEVKHAYAITSHMSQGSSYDLTFVDLEDLMANRNRSEAFRSLYVACTRQRKELYIC